MVLDYAVCRKVEPAADTVIMHNSLPASSYFCDAVMSTRQQHASIDGKVQHLKRDPLISAAGRKMLTNTLQELRQLRRLPSVILIVVVKLIVQVDGRLHMPRCCQSHITSRANTFQLQQWCDVR